MTYGQLFTDQADAYAQYRPSYPQHLYETVYAFAGLKSRDTCVDVGTGTGQAATVLAQTFKRVIAQDPSPGQLAQARRQAAPTNITYQEATAEDTGLPAASADLVTIAEALHWVDLPRFYKEVRRILKPEGALAAWGYALCFFDNEAADRLLHGFYTETVGPYWDERRRLIDAEYADMEPGPEHFAVVERANNEMSLQWTVQQMVGYLRSWSAYTTLRKRQGPDAPDPLAPLARDLEAALGPGPFRVRWPVFLILARQPVPLDKGAQ